MSGAKTKDVDYFSRLIIASFSILYSKRFKFDSLICPCSILIFTGYKLAKVGLFKDFYQKGLGPVYTFCSNNSCYLITDLLVGIVIGILVGLFFMVRSNFKSSVFVVNDENRYLVALA